MTIQEIKLEIKRLKRLKRDLRSGTAERLEVGRKLKELTNMLTNLSQPDEEKDKLISEIMKLDSVMASITIDLRKHSITDLQKYLNKLKEKK
jgi:hypothetical protein